MMSEPIDNPDYQIQLKSGGEEKIHFPKSVVMIPIVNSPIFPGMIAPIILSEKKFTSELDAYLLKSEYIALNLVKSELKDESGKFVSEGEIDLENRDIGSKDVYRVGVFCKVVKEIASSRQFGKHPCSWR